MSAGRVAIVLRKPVQHSGDRVRNLCQAVDLAFVEFTLHVRGLDAELATGILYRYPAAAALREVSIPAWLGSVATGIVELAARLPAASSTPLKSPLAVTTLRRMNFRCGTRAKTSSSSVTKNGNSWSRDRAPAERPRG
jgi:hypothetical protein